MVFISDKDMVKPLHPIFWTKITPNLNISARMSWSVSEILKPFKKWAGVSIIKCKNSQLRLEFLNLIIHSCSLFKQYCKSIALYCSFMILYSVLTIWNTTFCFSVSHVLNTTVPSGRTKSTVPRISSNKCQWQFE